MKKKITSVIYALGIVICLGLNLSCENFMDIHQDYIKEGERVYAPIVDSVTVYPGKGRIAMKLRYYNGHNLDRSTIYWNDKYDSLNVDLKSYQLSVGYDSIEVVIPDLPESAYSFHIINYDIYGNRSLEVATFGNSYGEDFQHAILRRSIRQLKNFDDRFEIHWAAASEQMVKVEVKYINQQGEEVVEIRDLEPVGTYAKSRDNEFVYRSHFLPEENAVDVFYTEWSDPVQLPAIQ